MPTLRLQPCRQSESRQVGMIPLFTTSHVSRITCHLPHIMFFVVFFLQICGASRWRVCYQRGLTRLVFSWTRNIFVVFTLLYRRYRLLYIAIYYRRQKLDFTDDICSVWRKGLENTSLHSVRDTLLYSVKDTSLHSVKCLSLHSFRDTLLYSVKYTLLHSVKGI